MRELTLDLLKTQLHYDPLTGVFTWLVSRGRYTKTGDQAGTVKNKDGYRRIRLFQKTYLASRLAWFYVNGVWPVKLVDHRDLDHTNDRIGNLREATKIQNGHNTGLRKTNTSGFKGVSWNRKNRKWVAQMRGPGGVRYLGLHLTKEAASAAFQKAEVEAYGEFSRFA